ncbi:hypothetical protein L1987_46312 [Smallanthus sonchifolius]|uniref:Uncharacterized protein n=1 Tax=Smallanthus sonchifolius TaxID=185202 RepID=A0ACB9FZZ1_9ASTR|nr:hypothetical protein L1987_46312 [Smallanthus sonchifolius]
MAKVIEKFFVASMLMWAVPVAILFAFNRNLFPGSADMSPYSFTLLSGFLAVISVNIVIAFYIYLAMKEPAEKHEPDPTFVLEAEASVKHESSSTHKKEERLEETVSDSKLTTCCGWKRCETGEVVAAVAETPLSTVVVVAVVVVAVGGDAVIYAF